jgi:hypothetical protein
MRKCGLFILACPIAVFAWGVEGHSLVARIAEAQLTTAVRARVAEILGPGRTLASVANWPDEVRRTRPETAPWHFINIPITVPHLDRSRDCPTDNCVLARINILRETLRDPATPAAARTEGLMFLIHFVGDMHQPLHCADNQDKGGNGVPVSLAGQRMNLHSAWDTGLLTRIGTEEELLPALLEESLKHAQKWRRGTVDDWAEEAHKSARRKVYGKLSKSANSNPVLLDAAYEAMAATLIRTQLEKAGVRLARVLNEALQ